MKGAPPVSRIVLVLPILAAVLGVLAALRADSLGWWAIPLYMLIAGLMTASMFILILASGVVGALGALVGV